MTNERRPWGREELERLIPRLDRALKEVEESAGFPVRPLGPMTPDECLAYFGRLLDCAVTRPLTAQERFLFEQLLSCFRQAVQAEALGHKGRYFVVSEADLRRLLEEG